MVGAGYPAPCVFLTQPWQGIQKVLTDMDSESCKGVFEPM